jgi:hypothetical protein
MFHDDVRRCVVTVLTTLSVAAAATRGAVYSIYQATTRGFFRRRGVEGGREGGAFGLRRRSRRGSGDGIGDDDALVGFGLARWEAAEMHDPLNARLLPSLELASRESRHSTNVVFKNKLDEKARIYWVNYQGELVRYKTLEPGQAHRQQTFETHPWTFTTVPADDAAPRRRLVVNGKPVFFAATSEGEGEGEGEGERGEQGAGAGGDDGDVRVFHIENPPVRRWTHRTHKDFPGFFKEVSRAFLLSHLRLRRRAHDCAVGIPTLTLESNQIKPKVKIKAISRLDTRILVAMIWLRVLCSQVCTPELAPIQHGGPTADAAVTAPLRRVL